MKDKIELFGVVASFGAAPGGKYFVKVLDHVSQKNVRQANADTEEDALVVARALLKDYFISEVDSRFSFGPKHGVDTRRNGATLGAR